MPALSVIPNPALAGAIVAVSGVGFNNRRIRLLLDGVVTGDTFRATKAGSFTVGIPASKAAKSQVLTAEQQAPGGKWSVTVRMTPLVTLVPPSGADVTAPILTNQIATAVSATSERITWTTSEPATSQVEYGLTGSYGSSTSLNSSLTTGHSVTITGLSAATLYHYRVKSTDAAGNQVVGPDQTFTTVSPTPVPTFSSILATVNSPTQATISWGVSPNSTGQVQYGLTTAYGQTTTFEPGYLPSHSQIISGLTAGGTYHFRVLGTPLGGTIGYSADGQFVVAGSAAPVDLQAAINAATAGSTINCTGGTYTAPAGGFTIAKQLTIIGGTVNSPSSQRAFYITGTNVVVDGTTIRGVGNTQDYGAGIWARAANGLIVRNCTITDFNYVGIGILNTNGGQIDYNLIQRIAGLGPAVEDNAYGIFFSDDDGGATYTRNMSATGNTITDIPRWQGINTHNGRNLTWTGNVTRRVRRAYWLAPTGSNRIVNCTVTGNFAYECDDDVGTGGSGYFVMNSDGCSFTGNYLSNTFSDASEPDAGEYVSKIRDYLSGSTTLTRNTTTVGA